MRKFKVEKQQYYDILPCHDSPATLKTVILSDHDGIATCVRKPFIIKNGLYRLFVICV